MTSQEKHEPSDLLAYALFENNPEVGTYRETLLAFLVCVSLFEHGGPATRREVFETCVQRFLPKGNLELHEIERVVAGARTYRLLVDAGDGRVGLSEERREQLESASEKIALVRETFHREISEAVEEELGEPLDSDLRAALRELMEGFIQRLFHEQSVALAAVFAKDGEGLDGLNTSQFSLESLKILVRSLTGQSEKLRQVQIAAGIRAGVLGLGEDGQRYLAAVYQKTVAFALLQQDPTVKRVRRQLMEARVFYLDTNVVMALMFRADSKHEQVRTAVEVARDVNCKLVVSPTTVEELELRIQRSDRRYEKVKPYSDLDFSILSDVVLRTFRLLWAENQNISWQSFLASYLPVADALEELGIVVDDEDAIRASHDPRRDRVRTAVFKNKPPYAKQVIDADTDNLLLIQLRREKIRADPMGRRVWLVTLDQTLKYAERDLINEQVYEVPSTKQVNSWVSVLSPHLSPDDEDLGEYVLRVVQSQLGLVSEDPMFADVDFVAVLAQSPFDLHDLLRSSSEKTRRVLVALQKEREIEEILKREPVQPNERDAWGERLTEVIMKALSRMDDSAARTDALEAELGKALGEVADLRLESVDHLRRIEELQVEILAQQPEPKSGLLARMRSRFGRPAKP
ncbi:MAG TPA: hypothetical protein VHR18_13510 [Solirubrobacterales bacterium]|nr:hypothetical protein [Solirubrobacterales bacterium]